MTQSVEHSQPYIAPTPKERRTDAQFRIDDLEVRVAALEAKSS